MNDEARFLDVVLVDPTVAAVLERAPVPRHVHEAKAARWTTIWPELTVLRWNHRGRDG